MKFLSLWRVICENCGYDAEFKTAGAKDDRDAVLVARHIHANANESQERHCQNDTYLAVTKLEKWAE
jgi:hypothetical protein